MKVLIFLILVLVFSCGNDLTGIKKEKNGKIAGVCINDNDCEAWEICDVNSGECKDSPCLNVDCGQGRCLVDDVESFHCECNNGYHEYENKCIANPLRVSTGNYFTCVLLNDGNVYCSGENFSGQLGNETNESSYLPVKVKDIANVKDITLGNEHACALFNDGKVKCWGNNIYGQLGDGTNENKNKPVSVKDLSGVVTVKAGAYHTCALLTDGKVKCWGMNAYAQLGNRKLENSNLPVYVVKDFRFTPMDNVSFIAVGKLHNCLQRVNGDIYCWGANGNGQLGINKDWKDYSSCRNENCKYAREIEPVNISSEAEKNGRFVLRYADYLVAGGNFTAAVKGTDAYLWGKNSYYQTGSDIKDNLKYPIENFQISGFEKIKLGGSQTCGIKDMKLYCMGRNIYGQFGDENIIKYVKDMMYVGDANNEYDIGINHGCLINDNRVKCWGSNIRGELGIDNKAVKFSSQPVNMSGF